MQPSIHWIVSILASVLFGTAGHIIFIASSIYVLMYGDYSSSAVSGQSFLREAMSAGLSIVGVRHSFGFLCKTGPDFGDVGDLL